MRTRTVRLTGTQMGVVVGVLQGVAIMAVFCLGLGWQRYHLGFWFLPMALGVFAITWLSYRLGHLYGYAQGVVAQRHSVPNHPSEPLP